MHVSKDDIKELIEAGNNLAEERTDRSNLRWWVVSERVARKLALGSKSDERINRERKA